MKSFVVGVFVLSGLAAHAGAAQSVVLQERSATVWSTEQVVRGRAEGTGAGGTLYVDGTPVAFTTPGDFAVPVRLGEGVTEVVACADAGGSTVCSDTLRWTLGYRLRPELHAAATVSGRTVTLHGRVLSNPDGAALAFGWRQDPGNPRAFALTGGDSTATATFPDDAPVGEYYFDWTATAADGDVRTARTFVTVDATGITPFDLTRDHAAWVDRATIYEVTPYNFVFEGRFSDVTARLSEIADLGVNTIWLQPVYATVGGGQGYDVVDYFAVRPDYGSEDELRTLIETAHGLGLKVLFDFVPNHTSVEHPYARSARTLGAASHYYGFYQRARSPAGVRYRGDEHARRLGQMDFIYYFWTDLVNLDYDNPEVQQWMIEAGRYWIERFGIDGYRIDAVWGVNARTPVAMQRWRDALKRLKPEVLLLGEDKATLPHAFDSRFDAAYDWAPEEGWVSHWAWQTSYSATGSNTLFKAPERDRARLLRQALTNNGQGFPPGAKVLRFMENNDTPRFLATHQPSLVTKMAAALLYTLPGLPLLYNGQEIGFPTHPYETRTLFARNRTIRSQQRYELFDLYERLLRLRADYAALYSDHFEEIDVAPDSADDDVFAYHRWEGDQHLFPVVNMGQGVTTVRLALPVDRLGLDAETTYYLTDLLTGDHVSGRKDELAGAAVTLPAFTTRILLLADHVVPVTVGTEAGGERPARLTLAQNYPNPFNPRTRIRFELPEAGRVHLAVYDVLGREVALLVDADLPAGPHEVDWVADAYASGVYFYHLTYRDEQVARRMILVK